MKKIHLNRAGQTLGIFNEDDIRAGLANGTFLPGDLAWYEGLPTWKLLGELEEFGAAAAAAPDASSAPMGTLRMARDPHQNEPLGVPAPPAASPEAALPVEQDEPAWERRAELGFFPALLQTIQQVLMKPMETFERMKQSGGLMTPLMFFIIPGWAGAVAAGLYQTVFTVIGGEPEGKVPALFGLGAVLFLAPILIALGSFIFSGILHLCLMLVGGANKPFETTYRVVCYGGGSTAILQVIPFCGGVLGGVWNLVVSIIGLHKTHEISVGKAALAVFLPTIVCCGLGIVLFFAFGGMALLAGMKEGFPQ